MNVFISPRFDSVFRARPLVLVDVGARGGLKKDWQAASRHLQTISFEPDPDEYQRLAGQSAGLPDRVFGVALHNRRGPVELYVAKDRGLSSVLEPNQAFLAAFPEADRFQTITRQRVEADTLDGVVEQHGIADIDFLKVDTQGSELFVLEGARETLRTKVVGVEVEVEFSPIYRDQPLFADIDKLLRGEGFQLFDLRPCYWKREAGRNLGGPYGQIIWADALYLKSTEALAAATASGGPGDRRAKTLKAVAVTLLYGYFDYALEIVRASDALDTDDRRAIEDALAADSTGRPPLPAFPGKTQLAAVSQRIARLFADPRGGWSVGEGRTGNR